MAENKENMSLNSRPPLGAEGHSSSPLGVRGLSSIYFIGIGGIGMSALARYFKHKGVKVSGFDKTETTLTKKLESEGIEIHYTDDISLAPKEVDWVVYTPAIPVAHGELNFYKNNGYEVLKRSDVLQRITESSFNICIAGTHGKTTVSSMVAHLLTHSGYGCNAFLGGIATNYNSNFWSSDNNVCVIEADEYDRSFLKLSPDVAVITSMDADHLDIYGTATELENAFIEFAGKVKQDGCLICKSGLGRSREFETARQKTYNVDIDGADVHADALKVINGSYVFNIVSKEWTLSNVQLNMGGLHNIENMLAAVTVAKYLQIADDKIKDAVATYKGVKRRFEYALNNEKHVLIDDYAHHPEELKALINGVRSLYAKKLSVVFQPHLFSRTNDQADGFAEVLAMADEVILLPIYPARELPMEGVTSRMISERMLGKSVQVMEKDEMMEWVKINRPELLVMAGAGDIDALVQPIKQILESN